MVASIRGELGGGCFELFLRGIGKFVRDRGQLPSRRRSENPWDRGRCRCNSQTVSSPRSTVQIESVPRRSGSPRRDELCNDRHLRKLKVSHHSVCRD